MGWFKNIVPRTRCIGDESIKGIICYSAEEYMAETHPVSNFSMEEFYGTKT